MSYAANALAACRERFTVAEIAGLMAKPYPDVLGEARARRASALVVSRWEETPESRRETPLIRALHAFYVEQEPPVPLVEWDGGIVE